VIIYFISYPQIIPTLMNIRKNQFTSMWVSIFLTQRIDQVIQRRIGLYIIGETYM
jgi:hypothetical protein